MSRSGRLVLILALVLVGGTGAVVQRALACSCAQVDPRTALAGADGAFIGTLVSSHPAEESPIPGFSDLILTFRVDEALKGELGAEIEVRTSGSEGTCGISPKPGERLGLLLWSHQGSWFTGSCGVQSPEELRQAARPLPAPDGSGPVRLVVSLRLGEVGLLALDGRGRTLAYGREPHLSDQALCPGSRRLLELIRPDPDGVGSLLVRDMRRFRVIGRRLLPGNAGSPGASVAVHCRDAEAREAVLLVTYGEGPVSHSRLLRVRAGRVSVLHRGTAAYGSFGGNSAFLAVGRNAARLIRVDLRTGREHPLGPGPGLVEGGTIAPSPAGTRVAVITPSSPRSDDLASRRVALVDASGAATRRRSVRVPESLGKDYQPTWTGERRLVLVPVSGGPGWALGGDLRLERVLDGWPARGSATIVDDVLYGHDENGLFAAQLPRGRPRRLRDLMGASPGVILAVPDPIRLARRAGDEASGVPLRVGGACRTAG